MNKQNPLADQQYYTNPFKKSSARQQGILAQDRAHAHSKSKQAKLGK
jgi:hypothetical protein